MLESMQLSWTNHRDNNINESQLFTPNGVLRNRILPMILCYNTVLFNISSLVITHYLDIHKIYWIFCAHHEEILFVGNVQID